MNHMYIKKFESFSETEYNNLLSSGKTYLKPYSTYKKNIENNISKYDISNFHFINIGIDMWQIRPDKDFLKLLNNQYDDLVIDFTLSNLPYMNDYNRIDFDGLPSDLRGYNLGYKIYKLIIKKFKFLSTTIGVNTTKIWSKLIKDYDFYAGVSDKYTVVIDKNINEYELLKIIKTISPLNLNYDKSLNERIDKINKNGT